MKKRISGLICGVVVLTVVGCAQEEGPAFTAETINASDLYTMFAEDMSYTDWSFWEDVEGLMEGQAPHGALVRSYANDPALTASGDAYPYGSLIIKENYAPDTTLTKLTVMYKVRDYNPGNGDWFWAIYGANGSVEGEGKIQGCISCHRARRDHDYTFLHDLN